MRMRMMLLACGLAVGVIPVAGAEAVMEETIASDVLLSGEANERLEDIGRRAAEEGLVLQVNAPDIWESEIMTPVRRGAGDGGLEVKFVNSMRDTVLIRGVEEGEDEDPLETLKRITNNAKARSIEQDSNGGDTPEAETSSAPAGSSRSEKPSGSRPDIEQPSMDVPEVRVERPRAELPRSDVRESARQVNGARAEPRSTPEPRPQQAERPDAASRQSGDRASAPDAGTAGEAAEKERFEEVYNQGRAIRRSLGTDQLKKDDLIYSGEHHNVVVRRGISTSVFWLDGELPENRIEHQERNRYVVVESKEER